MVRPRKYLREEGDNFQGFIPYQFHQLLVEVYGDHLHHNYGIHLDRDMADEALWKRRWRRLATQLSRCYSTLPGALGERFTACLAEEWRGFRDQKWNSKRPLVFSHTILKKNPGML